MKPHALFAQEYQLAGVNSASNSLLDILLANRALTDQAGFLEPRWEDNHDPLLMLNMRSVVERLWQAIGAEEKLVVYSDFDADGIPGAVVFTDFLRKIGFSNFEVYIPNRNTEGFGLNMQAAEQFIADKVDIVITIDCGIADLAEIQALQEGGVEVIVTDHHLPSVAGTPDCLILDPKQAECQYPFDELCGSGVIFKLVQAMLSQQADGYDINPEWAKWLLDMVGIATLCDMVPLVGENRLFAYYGLQVLRKSPRPGLLKLLSLARVNQPTLSAQDVAFSLGPRINAASRLGEPMTAYRALAGDGAEAIACAEELEKLNKARKNKVATAARAAYKQIEAKEQGEVIVVGDTSWPLGIVGLLAGTIAERYGKPAFVWTRVGEEYKGSVRSGGVCSIHELMSHCPAETFISFGGHAAAGGFVCSIEGIVTLEEKLNQAWHDTPSYQKEQTVIDSILTPQSISFPLYDSIAKLEPYGVGNRPPLFLLSQVSVAHVRTFGKGGEHVSLQLAQGGRTVEAISFNYLRSHDNLPSVGETIEVVAELEHNQYMGRNELRLRIHDLFYAQ